MSPALLASPLKIHQLDPDLQLRVKELSLTTLGEFRAMARQIRAIQESRWTRATDDQEAAH
jgi:anaerobic glycerol-3-phosphate dehydrogenase